MKIALVESDVRDAQVLQEWLNSAGHQCRGFSSRHVFAREVTPKSFELIIMGGTPSAAPSADIMGLLRQNGFDRVPVIRVLDQGSEEEMVAALRAGADDCIVKPVRQFELLARIEALARRAQRFSTPADDTLDLGNLSVDLKNRLILRNGERLELTPKTYNLALILLTNIGQLLSRSYLMERVWGQTAKQSTRTLDTHISRLRTVMGLTREHGWQLQSVYQHGYRLDREQVVSSSSGNSLQTREALAV